MSFFRQLSRRDDVQVNVRTSREALWLQKADNNASQFRFLKYADGGRALVSSTRSIASFSLNKGRRYLTINSSNGEAILDITLLGKDNKFFVILYASGFTIYKLEDFTIVAQYTSPKDDEHFIEAKRVHNDEHEEESELKFVVTTEKTFCIFRLDVQRCDERGREIEYTVKKENEIHVNLRDITLSDISSHFALYSRKQSTDGIYSGFVFESEDIDEQSGGGGSGDNHDEAENGDSTNGNGETVKTTQKESGVLIFNSSTLDQDNLFEQLHDLDHIEMTKNYMITCSASLNWNNGLISVFTLSSFSPLFVLEVSSLQRRSSVLSPPPPARRATPSSQARPPVDRSRGGASDASEANTNDGKHLWCSLCLNDKVLFVGTNHTVQLFEMATQKEIWNYQSQVHIVHSEMICDDRFLLVFRPKDGKLHPMIDRIPVMFSSVLVSTQTVLEQALKKVLAVPCTPPGDACDKLIRYENVRVSFSEWVAAHMLLTLAVRNGEVDGEPAQNGREHWWDEHLYACVREFDLGENDRQVAMRCVTEAVQINVLSSERNISGDELKTARSTHSNDSAKAKHSLQTADTFTLQERLSVDERLDKLQSAIRSYQESHIASYLLCIALQIIPVVHGTANILSGRDSINGVSSKDLGDYFLGFYNPLCAPLVETASGDDGDEPVLSMSDRVLTTAVKAMADEALGRMPEDDRRKLEDVLQLHGYSLGEVRDLFVEHSQHEAVLVEVLVDDVDDVDDGEVGAEEEWDGEREVSIEAAVVPSLPMDAILHESATNASMSNSMITVEYNGTMSRMDRTFPSDWTEYKLNRFGLDNISVADLAALWAAYIVQFRNERLEKYYELRDKLEEYLDNECLTAKRLRHRLVQPSEVADGAIEHLGNHNVMLKIGEKALCDDFVRLIHLCN